MIIVIGILAVVGVIAVSFAFSTVLETRAARNAIQSTRALYLAEAGVTHARAVLTYDALTTRADHLEEAWRTAFAGGDVDSDGDGQNDARWLTVTGGDGRVIGRYAVLVTDEAGKLDVAVASAASTSQIQQPGGWTPYEIDLERGLGALGVANARQVARGILAFRYGPDGEPGAAGVDDDGDAAVEGADGIDNDGDGLVDEAREGIDEPDEYQPLAPTGDDRAFTTPETLRRLAGISAGTWQRLRNSVTLYAKDVNLTARGGLRVDVNHATAEELLAVLLEAGVPNPWPAAVNLRDAADADAAFSTVTKRVRRLGVVNEGPKGGWTWQDSAGAYHHAAPGGAAGQWTWSDIPAGEYAAAFYGTADGQCVGDVTIGEATQPQMRHGDLFTAGANQRVTISDGTLRVTIGQNAPAGQECVFQAIELVPFQGGGSAFSETTVRGVEAIRINELMVRPAFRLMGQDHQTDIGLWSWSGSAYVNGTPGSGAAGEGEWVWDHIPPGRYYATLYGAADGDVIGDVNLNGTRGRLTHGERFSALVSVGSSQRVTMRIQNNEPEGTSCRFASLELSQQPDAEYVELVNLSDAGVVLDLWKLRQGSGDAVRWTARIPVGTTMPPRGYLVLAVDQADAGPPGLAGNGISFTEAWGSHPAVQLEFQTTPPTETSDVLADHPTPGVDVVTLLDADDRIVDRVEYAASQVTDYRSLEKGDPTVISDGDGNGVDDGWWPSQAQALGTPGQENENDGLIERLSATDTITHHVSEQVVHNRPMANLGELGDVASGTAWKRWALSSVAAAADRLTVFSQRLEAEGHAVAAGAWREELRHAPQTSWFVSTRTDDEGTWRWTASDGIMNGWYRLSVVGQAGEAVAVSVLRSDGTPGAWTPPLTPDSQGRALVGYVDIGTGAADAAPPQRLEVSVKNASPTNIAHLDYILLEPLPIIRGRLNINTASAEVLQAATPVTPAIAQAIVAGRPYGTDPAHPRGIGDLLLVGALGTEPERLALFRAVSNLITTRSNVFEVIVTGQALNPEGRVTSTKQIRTVIER